MSKPFPSPEYIKECIENAGRLWEEWEPKGGDWAWHQRYGAGLVINTELSWGCDILFQDWANRKVMPMHPQKLIPLFQPRQLWEMLEERGYEVFLRTSKDPECPPAYVDVVEGQEQVARGFGPDPATALLRAWLEVVKDGD